MAFDAGLAQRVREYLEESGGADEKKMFGGLCFTRGGHMCCGVLGDSLIARVGPQRYDACLRRPHAREMDFTGRPMTGMVCVDPAGLDSDEALAGWLRECLAFVGTLPPKAPRKG